MARISLINYINPRKLRPELVNTVQDKLKDQSSTLSKKNKSYSIQLDPKTYQLLKDFKDKYDSYFYTSVRDSLVLMATILKSNKNR